MNPKIKKGLFVTAFASIGFLAQAAYAAPYFTTIVGDPKHPKVSETVIYTSKVSFDGALTDVAIAYHKADPEDCLWPDFLLKKGMPPISWTLLEMGIGGNKQTAFIHAGASVNLAPTLLGPVVSGLKEIGGKAAKLGALLVSDDGSGLKLGIGWKSNIIEDGGLKRFDEMRFPPRYGIGYSYQF